MTGALVASVLEELERYYEADAEEVCGFLQSHPPGERGREALLVREGNDALELALVLPAHIANGAKGTWRELSLDERCQLIEGVSHFLVICERARSGRSTTHLELELQAEVDKWLVLSRGGRLESAAEHQLRDRLFERVEFLHPRRTAEGERYRLANSLAAKFVHRLSRSYARPGRLREMRRELGRFFRMGQEEKLRAMALERA